MQNEIDVKWNGNMTFRADIEGHGVTMDLDMDRGGNNTGPRPKPLMLASLGGCSGMDVITILKKMKIVPQYFNMRIIGEQTEEFPRRYIRIKVIYEFGGEDLPLNKLKQAVELSQNKYCGVSAVYREAVELSYEIRILQEFPATGSFPKTDPGT